MFVTTKYGSSEIRDEDLQILLVTANDFPTIIRFVGKGEKGGSFFLATGEILMWRWEREMYFIYRSLDDVLRSCVHANAKYGRGDQRGGAVSELARLSELIARHEALWYMVVDWKNLSSADRQRYEELCLTTTEEMSKARNVWKIAMGRRAALASTIIDSLGRVNPPRTQALQATVRENARSRRAEVSGISFKLDARRLTLLNELDHDMDILRRAIAGLREVEGRKVYANFPSSPNQYERLKTDMKNFIGLLGETEDIPFTHVFNDIVRNDLRPIVSLTERLERGCDISAKKEECRTDITKHLIRALSTLEVFLYSREMAELRLRLAFALSRRPRRPAELAALRSELAAFRDSMVELFDAKVDRSFRHPPLSHIALHVSRALLELDLNDFAAMARELDTAENIFAIDFATGR